MSAPGTPSGLVPPGAQPAIAIGPAAAQPSHAKQKDQFDALAQAGHPADPSRNFWQAAALVHHRAALQIPGRITVQVQGGVNRPVGCERRQQLRSP